MNACEVIVDLLARNGVKRVDGAPYASTARLEQKCRTAAVNAGPAPRTAAQAL
jgi:hypothetical protein